MAFTGQVGTANSMPSQVVPMFGAGGTKRAKSLTASLTPTGFLSFTHTFVFTQTSVTAYRAVSRVVKFVTTLRTGN
jgi:hypothetical protein